MSTLNVDKVDPSTGTALEIGSSGDTITVPSGATFAVSGTMNASSITAGTVATARLGSGTADGTTFLRGDQTYAAPGGGITEADTWRITTGFTGNENPITANWERDDTAGFGLLGTGMSESSGVFTFPSTGYWLVGFNSTFYGGASENQYVLSNINVTTNNSSYAEGSASYDSVQGSGWQGNASVTKMVDVTDTANVKVRFGSVSQDDNHVTNADTAVNYNYVTFIRLADT